MNVKKDRGLFLVESKRTMLLIALLGLSGCQAHSRLAFLTGGSNKEAKGPDAAAVVLEPAQSTGACPAPVTADETLYLRTPDATLPLQAIPSIEAEQPIDLEAALVLGGADNPTIALADEAVRASRAEQLQARALLLPTLDAGSSYNWHRGNLQSSQGIILDVDRQSLFAGAGAFAVGAGTVGFPGVRLTAHLADALFEPTAAQHAVNGQLFNAEATRNRLLLEVLLRYFDLVGAEVSLAAIRQSEAESSEVVRLTANFARLGQGRAADAERARTDSLLLHTQEERVQEEVAVAAANLARLLSLDPSVRLRTAEAFPPLLHLVDVQQDLEKLIEVGLRTRPEIGVATTTIAIADTHRSQERLRPLLPLLSVGYSAGTFGGGSDQADTRFGHFHERSDFDALAVWSLDNLGFGNRAEQGRARAAVGQAVAVRTQVIDQVRREIAEAYAQSRARFQEVAVARRHLQTADEGFRLDFNRAKNLEGRAIEVLNSLNQLAAARQELIRAVIGFDQAQFRLFVALGQPPTLAPREAHSCP